MSDMIKPSFFAPEGRSVVGVFADPIVARASADVVRERGHGRKVRVFERVVRAGGCDAQVWVVIDVGPRTTR